MKNLFLISLFLISFRFDLLSAQFESNFPTLRDSSRNNGSGQESSSRTTISRNSSSLSFSDEFDAVSNCMCCLFNTLGDIIFPDEDEKEPEPEKKTPRYLDPYRLYAGLRLGMSAIISESQDYERGGVQFGASLNAYVNGFNLSAVYDYSIVSGTPNTDFVTNFSLPGNHTREFYDIPSSTSISASVLGIGLGYYFPVYEDYDGTILELGFALKANYFIIKEETEFTRDVYEDDLFTNSLELDNTLTFKKFAPGFSLSILLIPPFSDKLAFEGSLDFLIYNRTPEELLSTPLDNYEFLGLASFVFGIKYSL